MLMRSAAVCLVCLCALQAAPPPVPVEEYRARRNTLRKSLADGALVLYALSTADADEFRGPFRQESNFFYLTGWNEPGAILLILPGSVAPREILFLPEKNPRMERWTGPRSSPSDSNISAKTGFSEVETTKSFESRLPAIFRESWKMYLLPEQPASDRLKSLLPRTEAADARPLIAKLRMKKSVAELAQIQYSIDVSVVAHRAAWERIAPGVAEYQVAAAFSNVLYAAGCERPAYAPIVASGPNSNILHYSANSRRMDAGEVLLMDAAGECAGYAADITRTLPVARDFTSRQREIYQIVLGAQRAVIAAVKPGMALRGNTPTSLAKIAADYFNSHGKDLRGEPLGKYLIHGICHHVGLDVHDADVPGSPLEPGMVITVEPGLYLPDEGFGVRIEDIVLVTGDGAKVLTAALPSDEAAIRKLRGRKPRFSAAP